GAPVLRQKAKKIRRVDDSIQRLVDDLIDTVLDAPGAGLAAPQIGIPLRALVTNVDETMHVLLNPQVVAESEEEIEADEACLSIPGWTGPVMRKERVTVRGLNEKGKSVKLKVEEWEARVFQHEIDHLDGILYIDKVTDPERLRKVEREEEILDEAQEETVPVSG
ncbi:MAG: peptide deformylase, partial [Chloroflexota bacterium]